MIDIKLLRAEPDRFIQGAAAKRIRVDIPALLELDRKLLEARKEAQDIKTQKNKLSEGIGPLARKLGELKKNKDPLAASRVQAEAAELQKQIADLKAAPAALSKREKELTDLIAELEPKFNELMLVVPQPSDPEVPGGKDDTENVVLRTEGTIRKFDFPPKDHMQLGEALDIIDVPRGVKLAGTRNYFLKGAGAMLHQAVLRLAMDQMIAKGYTPLTPPVLVNESVMYGTGYFPIGRDQAYLVERDGMSLVGTAEVPVTAYHTDEILTEAELPKKYVAMSTCFRREAGAAGKDTYGLYRIHLFDKIEQVVIGPNDRARSIELHQEILQNAEDVLKALELPYRVCNVCTGDLGLGQAQKFDIETWMPSRGALGPDGKPAGAYGETHSASRFYEFQARRLNIRYRAGDGTVRFCHTLNNTVIASPRVLIPILELYQNADGSVTVPAALRPYMGGMEKITSKT
jgi:seryl-tRNA synthetase